MVAVAGLALAAVLVPLTAAGLRALGDGAPDFRNGSGGGGGSGGAALEGGRKETPRDDRSDVRNT
jgi:hypothetical protein